MAPFCTGCEALSGGLDRLQKAAREAAHEVLQESSQRPRYATYWSEESEGSDQESEGEDLYESTPAWHRYFDRAKARS